MTPMDLQSLVEAYCRLTGKWALHISFYVDDGDDTPEPVTFSDIYMAAPYLDADDEEDSMSGILSAEAGVLIFDTSEEMEEYFEMTVGDDGYSNKRNSYDGLGRVYAMKCGPDGLLGSNT